jgi:hypothetical protein
LILVTIVSFFRHKQITDIFASPNNPPGLPLKSKIILVVLFFLNPIKALVSEDAFQ